MQFNLIYSNYEYGRSGQSTKTPCQQFHLLANAH